MMKIRTLTCMAAFFSIAIAFLIGGGSFVAADGTAQTVPFTQDWTNIGLITTNDNWSGVPGIEGYLGQDITVTTGVDPQTLLTTSSVASDLDVIANQTNPNTLANGGVAEFEITNPTIALQGSGTADAPYVIIYLNTTGHSNINVAYNLRDIDGSTDNSVQPVALQYRIGNTGNFTNLPAGFVADATTGPSTATLVTPVSVTLPGDANNQPIIQVRIITANAAGNDEWVGVDDINITAGGGPTPTPATQQHVVDFNGDGKTDFAVVRNTGGGATGQVTWLIQHNGLATGDQAPFGIASDFFVPEDYDGDNKTDIAIWRGGPSGVAAFYILQSQTFTVRAEAFGITGDDPTVVGDYNGDNKADMAVYRAGAAAGQQSTWFYRTAPNGGITFTPWGVNGDFPYPGDRDGDNKNDFTVQRPTAGQGAFWTRTALGTTLPVVTFGLSTDLALPGDYDGDNKTDIAVARGQSVQIVWYVLASGGGAAPYGVPFGISSDFPTQGDYDGDGKTDISVWRPSATPGQTFFYWINSTGGSVGGFEWGQTGDYPVANYNTH